jgi:N-acetyl-D-muramate 6-phosphate phosphatase
MSDISRVSLVLFDLDGTLADTAPDLAAAINRMLTSRSLPPLPYEQLRPWASHGARGMIGCAFRVTPGEPGYFALRDEFLAQYEAALCVETVLFPRMAETLAALEANGMKWGIVTNKLARFTDPLIEALGLTARAACVVSGDTTAHAKPHPAPVLHALRAAGSTAESAVYVGDDLRDIEAGRAAGLRTVVATYGYLGEALPYPEWGADHIIHSPEELVDLVIGRP